MKRAQQAPETLTNRLLTKVQALAAPHGLMEMGGVHTPPGTAPQTLVLVGTARDFWQGFTGSPEHSDGQADAVDRWSQRIMPAIAEAAGAIGVAYPFGGPPYAPFISWAKQSRQAFDSPTGMLVHTKAGLMISYRGALIFRGRHSLPATAPNNPCDSCSDRPCVSACPIGALSDAHFYDVAACKTYISGTAGAACMTQGCATRRVCPVSQSFNRSTDQTAFHMRAFRGN